MLTQIYVPPYFIGRTRTSDDLLGDPVNLALNGTSRQIHAAMTKAGWILADDVTVRSSWAIIVSSVFKRSYSHAPVSPLMLFGRRQCLAYQQEVSGNASQRHHVRFWRCPDGWLLPGGRRVQWLGAGTYDKSVGLSLFTLQVTHKIDANIDIERDYIVSSLQGANPEVRLGMLKDFSTGYHHRNGGGDVIRTDGDLPVLDLTAITPAGAAPRTPESAAQAAEQLPLPVIRAGLGYPIPTDEGGVAAPDPDSPTDLPDARTQLDRLLGRQRPVAITVACICAAAMSLYAWVELLTNIALLEAAVDPALSPGSSRESTVFIATLVAAYLCIVLLAVLTYRGRSKPRVWLMFVTALIVGTDEVVQWTGLSESGWPAVSYINLLAAVVILLTLTTPSASAWSRGRSLG
ncbi:LssY C-terminal domain-containing protein [Corynebacterium heidelbergense]|uniref:LssY C-terminal domain-containing protein n=1 Tax=Corynebacterium heidelbergense TaxID=2055947 RepID=UPI001EE758E4|nr:LssY C-terminal domain-containing protein [Corynebacterium heidelbergense]WCZ35715.1 hypothetical protein CHEID_00680 [Corynebacterium heidelbergense]